MVNRLIILSLIFLPVQLFAGTISVKADRNPVSINQTFHLTFTVKGSQDDEPDFSPLNDKFELLGTSTSSQFSVINGDVTSSKQYTLTVVAKEVGTLSIPAINFGKDMSPATPITVNSHAASAPASLPNDTKVSASDELFVELETDISSPYVQQQIVVRLKIYRRVQWAGATLSDPSIDGAETLVQRLGEEQHYQVERGGKKYAVTEVDYAFFPQQSGTLTINPFEVTAKLPSKQKQPSQARGGRFNDPLFDSFFSRQTYITKVVRSKAITLDVKPIPASFKGEYWLPAKELKLQQHWSTADHSLTSGEPVTRTIAIIADGLDSGQLPDIEIAEQHGLKVYPDQATTNNQATEKGILSTRSQKYALIPSKDGILDLPVIQLPWWNVQTDQLEIALLDSKQFDVISIAPSSPSFSQPEQTTTTPISMASAPATESIVTGGMQRWLIASNIIMFLLWLITLAAWLKAKQKPMTTTPPGAGTKPPTSDKALRALQATCKGDDAVAIRTALLHWGESIWVSDPPQTIGDIATRVHPELASQINLLNENIYGASVNTLHMQVIADEAAVLSHQLKTSKTPEAQPLQGLYR